MIRWAQLRVDRDPPLRYLRAMLPALSTATLWGIPLRRLFVVAAALVLVFNLGLRLRMVVQHRTELGGVEHNVVHGIQKVMLGLTLYQDPEAPPFDVIQYTPAYTLLCALSGKALGLHGHDARAIYLLNRSVALMLNLMLGWLTYRCAQLAGAPRWTAILAACFTFSTLWEQFYGRMDALCGVATLAAFLHFIRYSRYPSSRQVVFGTSWALVAIMAKQSGLVALAAPALFFVVERNWTALRLVALTSMAGALVSLAVLLPLGQPWHVYQNTVLGLANGYSSMMWDDLFYPATYKYFIGWHLIAVVVCMHSFRSREPRLRLLAMFVAFSTVFALLTGLKSGSRLSYLHESLTFTFIASAALCDAPFKDSRWKALGWGFALYGCLFAAFRTNSALAWYRVGEPDAWHEQQLQDDMVVRDVLVEDLALAPTDGLFIIYREYLEHFFVGQSMLTQKDIVTFSTTPLFDYSRFHEAMNDGTIRYVISRQSTGPITYLDSTYAGWHPIRTVNDRTIFARDHRP